MEDNEVAELWNRYKPLEGKDSTADLVLKVIRKLVIDGASAIPYGNWNDPLGQFLYKYGIPVAEWDTPARAQRMRNRCGTPSADDSGRPVRSSDIVRHNE